MNFETFSEPMDEGCNESVYRQWPLVSVIVATYKRAHKLRRALNSVLAQTFTDMEVWCIHDGPPDEETIQVYEEYAEKFNTIGIDFYPVATDFHSGYYCIPRNTATENCRGVYVANLDDDNEWVPTALEVLVSTIDSENVDIVYGRRHYTLEDDAPTDFNGVPLLEGDSPYVPWTRDAKDALALGAGNNFIDSSDFIASKGALYRLAIQTGKLWNEEKRRFGDYDLIVRAAWASDLTFKGIDKIVQNYYIHGNNISLTRPAVETPRETRIYG